MKQFSRGLASSFGIVTGYVPVAIAFGVSALGAGLSPWLTTAVSALVYAGASQFVLVGTLAQGATPLAAAGLALALNLRHLIYGPTLGDKLRGLGHRRRAVLSLGLTDEVFATTFASPLTGLDPRQRFAWMLGLECGAYLAWVGGTLLGALGGTAILSLSPMLKPVLEFALPLLFVLLLEPLVTQARGASAAVAGVALAAVLHAAGMTSWALIAAGLGGVAVGLIWKRP
jgi:4-azaleucine resistance transporter AzlC